MAAEHARESWTDERLDDLARRMDAGFAELSARIDRMGERVDVHGLTLSERIDRQGESLSERIDRQGEVLGARIDALQRTMLQIGGGVIASIIVGAAGIVATQL